MFTLKFPEFFNFTFEHDNPEDFLVSQWQSKEKSLFYVIYRWIIAIFFVKFVLCWFIGDFIYDQGILIDFIYITNLNLILTTATVLISALLATRHYRGNYKIKSGILKIFWFMWTTSTTFAVLISLNYWILVYDAAKEEIDLNNIVSHILNSVILMIDLCVTRYPGRFGLFIYPTICSVGYQIFNWLYIFFGGVNK